MGEKKEETNTKKNKKGNKQEEAKECQELSFEHLSLQTRLKEPQYLSERTNRPVA